MNSTTVLILVASLITLAAGAWAWQLTSNFFLLINTTLASFGLLYAAGRIASHSPVAFLVPLMCTMLLGGRFAGTWWRSRKEVALRLPAQLIGATAAMALTATVSAYCAI